MHPIRPRRLMALPRWRELFPEVTNHSSFRAAVRSMRLWGLPGAYRRLTEITAGARGFQLPEPDPDLQWLTDAWRARWSDTLPVGWSLRSRAGETWVRFHSLPESKRYADNENEYAILLDRHHQVLDDLRGDDPDDLVVIRTRCDVESRYSARRGFRDLAATAPLWRTFLEEDDPDYPLPWYSFVQRMPADSIDPLLRAIADDEDRAIFTNATVDWLYAPYDGGVDVMSPSLEVRDRLSSTYAAWLPDNPAGL